MAFQQGRDGDNAVVAAFFAPDPQIQLVGGQPRQARRLRRSIIFPIFPVINGHATRTFKRNKLKNKNLKQEFKNKTETHYVSKG